ncbi:MAG: DNA primase [Clostridia bacterium]|nr:DNA primase [Clostridia bacterium]
MSGNHFYPEEIIEEVISRNDIVEVISDYVKITRKGKDYFGLCPFHNEKTPSFSVVPGKQIFYCFGCGKGGNVTNFIKNIENLDYIDSIKFLAERVSMVLPESNDPKELDKQKKSNVLVEINQEAAKFYYHMLKSEISLEARKYFSQRALSSETITKFGLGFAPNEWNLLHNHLVSKGYKEKDIFDAGLILRSSKGTYYDRFRNRIMFPIIDIRNRVIAFGGRILDGEGPKYLNSPETQIYNKRMHLYGMNIAKNTKSSNIIVVEGYMDCITLHQAGIENVVASLGTALTNIQAKLLKKSVSEVIISYDSDLAGQKATIRGLDLLAKVGCSVKVLTLDGYKDPDEYIKSQGSNQFRKLITNSLPLVEYKAMLLRKAYDLNTTDGKIKFLNGVSKAVAQVNNAVEREMYVKNISMKYNVSEQALMTEIRKLTGESKEEDTEVRKVLDVKLIKSSNMLDKDFYSIIAILCVENHYINHVIMNLGDTFITKEKHLKLFKQIEQRVKNDRRFDETYISSIIDEEDVALFSGIAASLETSYDLKKTLEEKIDSYKMAVVKINIDDITRQLTAMEVSDSEYKGLQEKLLYHMNILRGIKKQ